ncbi:MAG: DUF6029 family protein [Dysgonamonadaceae bacterium]|jgi:hypothetical protein|nr:DUF6029 family protein [Dysgonamonadaceae bacterium]
MKRLFFLLPFYLLPLTLPAQTTKPFPVSLHGSIQSDWLVPQEDTNIGAQDYDEFALTNTYVDLNLISQYVDAGTRFEFLKYPLPGYEDGNGFSGYGLPFFYATGKYKKAKLTIGDFYDQFGNGLIFRTYEDRNIGVDNSLRGARLFLEPFQGVQFKALGGQQRRYWEHNAGAVWGSDLELHIDQWIRKMAETNTYLMLGGSFVSKNEPDEDVFTDATHRLNLPRNVGAFDVRAQLQKGNFSFLAEYAEKANDPSKDNGYIYKKGNALLLSGSYAKTGMSILLQAKRSDNMTFRSKRSDMKNPSFINRLPAFTAQQTYALATLYPYATQPDGEWAFQGTVSYNFKRKTLLGGKYGTTLKLNVSHIRNIDKYYVIDYNPSNIQSQWALKGTDGYTSSFFKFGKELYYQDINLSLDKKITQDFKLNLMYMNQKYNPKVVRNEPEDIITSNIFIAEGKYNINKKMTLRAEAQYLHASDYTGEAAIEHLDRVNQGDWLAGVLELSVLPYFMFTVQDMYNSGATDIHYYKALVSFTCHAHFIQFGYGRTRAGRDCSGGVCRDVPASRGFILSYNYNF